MSRPVVFSASSVATYRECGLKWWFGYVAVLPTKGTVEMATGIAVHAAAEAILHAKMLGHDATEEQALTVYRTAITDEGYEPTAQGDDLVRLYLRDVAPAIAPVLVEEPFQIEVNGIPYSGIMDCYDRAGFMRDLKTVKSRPSGTSDRYWFAQVGYALGARSLTGQEEKGTVLDYLVKTKTPYYWPVASPPVSDEDIDLFAAILEGVAEQVDRGRFEADGLYKQGVCVRCPYAGECGPYLRMTEGQVA